MKILFNQNVKFNFNSSFQGLKKQVKVEDSYSSMNENDYKNYSNAVRNMNAQKVNFSGHDEERQEKIKYITELYRRGISKEDIAKQFGYSVSTVQKILKKEGLSAPKNNDNVEKLMKIAELINQGVLLKDIAREVGCSSQEIKKAISFINELKF